MVRILWKARNDIELYEVKQGGWLWSMKRGAWSVERGAWSVERAYRRIGSQSDNRSATIAGSTVNCQHSSGDTTATPTYIPLERRWHSVPCL